jgi:hypothetical protein
MVQQPVVQPQRPMVAKPQPAQRSWYSEPAVIATIVVLVLVMVAFLILLATASG